MIRSGDEVGGQQALHGRPEEFSKWLRSIRTQLYVSHFLSRWGSRMWEFAAVLLLVNMSPGSLFLVSLHGILQNGSVTLLAPLMGKLVDHTHRRLLLVTAVEVQNAALIVAALLSAGLTLQLQGARGGSVAESLASQENLGGFLGMSSALLFSCGVTLLLLFSACGSVAETCRALAIERDWVVVLAAWCAAHDSASPAVHPRTAVNALSPKKTGAGSEEAELAQLYGTESEEEQTALVPHHGDSDSDSAAINHSHAAAPVSQSADAPVSENGATTNNTSTTMAGKPAVAVEVETASAAAVVVESELPSSGPLAANASPVSPVTPKAALPKEQEDGEYILGSMNAVMKRVDLVCRLVAPAMVGVLMGVISIPAVCVAIACWNGLSMFLETWLIRRIHGSCPDLHGTPCSTGTPFDSCQCWTRAKDSTQQAGKYCDKDEDVWGTGDGQLGRSISVESDGPGGADISPLHAAVEEGSGRKEQGEGGSPVQLHSAQDEERLKLDEEGEAQAAIVGGPVPAKDSVWQLLTPLLEAAEHAFKETARLWHVYLRQTSILTGISLALLYFTVLSFGDLMVAYLRAVGIPVMLLGLLSAMAAVSGMVGTFLFPLLLRRKGLLKTALFASGAQWACLLPAALAAVLAAGQYEISPWLLIGTVVLSRVGLWMFDIAALQIIQNDVQPHERGQVGGAQAALKQLLELLTFVMCAFVHSPLEFWIPLLASFTCTSLSALLFLFYYAHKQGWTHR